MVRHCQKLRSRSELACANRRNPIAFNACLNGGLKISQYGPPLAPHSKDRSERGSFPEKQNLKSLLRVECLVSCKLRVGLRSPLSPRLSNILSLPQSHWSSNHYCLVNVYYHVSVWCQYSLSAQSILSKEENCLMSQIHVS